MPTASAASAIAMPRPGQRNGPAPNATRVRGCSAVQDAAATPASACPCTPIRFAVVAAGVAEKSAMTPWRQGSNTSGLRKKRGSWWIWYGDIATSRPAGMLKLPANCLGACHAMSCCGTQRGLTAFRSTIPAVETHLSGSADVPQPAAAQSQGRLRY